MKIALIVLLALVGIVIAGALLAGPQMQLGMPSFSSSPSGTKVRIQTVKVGHLIETIKAPGKIEPHTKVDISAEVAAKIEALPFREGELVRKGDVVVKLDDRNLKAALASSKARSEGEQYRLQSETSRLTGQLSTLSFAKKQRDRDQALFDSGDLSRKAMDDSQERVQDLEAQVEATKFAISNIESSLAGTKADIDSAQESLAKTVIRAPMDGVITALNAEIGEVVLMGTMNNAGTVILTIADLSRMIMKAEVAESDIARIKLGQPAKVHINAYREETYSGTVTQIALQRTDEKTTNTGYFKTEVEIDLRGGRILSGCVANVDIEVSEFDKLLVEGQAVVDRLIDELPDQVKKDNPLVDRAKKATTVAYRVINGRAVCTPVRRGASDEANTVILDGLKEGDQVIVGPFKVLQTIKHDEAVMDEATAPGSSGESGGSEGGAGIKVRVGR